MLCGRCGSYHYSAAASQEKGNYMSGIKELLFELMEQEQQKALSGKTFTEEEMAMARYDHISSDAASFEESEVDE